MEAYAFESDQSFSQSIFKFQSLVSTLQSCDSHKMDLSAAEILIEKDGREILRCLLEEHFKLRGPGMIGDSLEGSDSIDRSHKRIRPITKTSIFGEINIDRTVYSARGHTSLVPKDAMLNLPEFKYSHNLEQQLAFEAAKNSFEASIETVSSRTGVKLPKRQAEEIAGRVSQDFDDFYAERLVDDLTKTTAERDLLVLTTDAKGIVVRQDDLREATKVRAKAAEKKLKKRLSKGEKKNAKRMAQVASVYSIDSNNRTPEQIMSTEKSKTPPRPQAKRVWANIASETKTVITEMFDEAERRDPSRQKPWVVLIDGQEHQFSLINAEIESRNVDPYIVLDIIHVIQYLWKAARDFYSEDDTSCEDWINHYLLMILNGKAVQAAAGMRRSATRQGIKSREKVETCAHYLHTNSELMHYDEYLAKGLPIGTGVIEGACRHLIKDRMDITGAKWSLGGAEAILRLRSIYVSGDWDDYCMFHQKKEYERNHKIHYARPERLTEPKLRLIK